MEFNVEEKKEKSIEDIEEQNRLRNRIGDFEDFMKTVPGVMHGDCLSLKHSFAPGIYVREIFIPKGMVIVGKIHRYEHPNFLMSGEVSVVTEGKGTQHLKAPMSIISPAGTKRIVYAIEDTVWITVHATNETDVAKIEEEVIVKSYDEYECEQKGIYQIDSSKELKEV